MRCTAVIINNISRARSNDAYWIGIFLLSGICFISIVLYNLFTTIFLPNRSYSVPGDGYKGKINVEMLIIHVISVLVFDQYESTSHLVCVFSLSQALRWLSIVSFFLNAKTNSEANTKVECRWVCYEIEDALTDENARSSSVNSNKQYLLYVLTTLVSINIRLLCSIAYKFDCKNLSTRKYSLSVSYIWFCSKMKKTLEMKKEKSHPISFDRQTNFKLMLATESISVNAIDLCQF